MPTILQRHKDRIGTLDSTLRFSGIQNKFIPFGNASDGSLISNANFTFDTTGNILTVNSGTINSTTLNIVGTTTTGSLSVIGSASIGGGLSITGNETLHGTLTTGTLPVSTTNSLGYVNVTALSPGPVGTWLTTDAFGVVNWGAYPNLAAGWTFTGTQIYSNAGVPVRVNNNSTGPEIFNAGGSSVFQGNLDITTGGINITGPISVGNGHGTAGQALFSNGTGSAYWSTFGGLTGTNNVTASAYFRVPYADSFHNLDANDDLQYFPAFGSHRTQFLINCSTGKLGNQKLQVNDDADGLGGAIFRTTSDKGVEINDPGTNIGGANNANIGGTPNGVNTLLYLNTFTPNNNWNYFLCAQPASVGGPLLIKAFMTQGGSLVIAGTLSAGTKPFSIPHPLPELTATKNLVHMAVESAKSDLIYRGKVKLASGKAEINLDTANKMTEGTLSHLVDLPNGEVWIQNKTSFAPCQGNISGNVLTINCQNLDSTDVVSWLVMLERIDKTVKESGLCDDAGYLICEHEKGLLNSPV